MEQHRKDRKSAQHEEKMKKKKQVFEKIRKRVLQDVAKMNV
jgi:hypothetical protein